MATVAATFNDSTWRLNGMVNRQAASLLVWADSPRLSFPTARTMRGGTDWMVSIGTASRLPASAAKISQPFLTNPVTSAAMKIGRDNSAPLVARTTLGLYTSAESGVSQSALTFNAAAVRMIAPTFAGSCNCSPYNPNNIGQSNSSSSFQVGCRTTARIPWGASSSELVVNIRSVQ